jgi:hypothetical protein
VSRQEKEKKKKWKGKKGMKENRKNELSIFLEIMICNLY